MKHKDIIALRFGVVVPVVVLMTILLAFPSWASAQGSGALPGVWNPFAGPVIRHVERTVLHDNIAHYTYDVRVGPGQSDAIRLHRVVRERHPYQPISTIDGVLLLPGAPNSVEMIFVEPLISEVPAWDHSVTAFLAKNDIDVWGMDYRWALVPATQQDFTFMKDWDLQRDIRDTEIALSLARTIRWMTGPGGGQLHLLGFSWGLQVAYGVAGDETQKPPGHRSVKGLIPVDSFLKTDNEAERVATCAGVEYEQGLLDSGVYRNDGGVFLKSVGDLAKSDPYGESPLAPPFTNFQFALLAGAGFVGGYFDESGVPTGLRYTDPELWVDALRAVPPYVPTQAL